MGKVIGLGGIFLKCNHYETTREWYSKHLGIQLEPWGTQFFYKNDSNPEAYSNLSFFKPDTNYLAPSTASFMINFRVDDLEGLLENLKKDGIPLVGDPISEVYGKFAWVMDPEGNKIELWEQAK